VTQSRSSRLLVAAATLLWGSALARAADTPPTAQGLGEHSSITTKDGSIRDDELAKFIEDKLSVLDQEELPSEAKIFVQSCYGGGMLDDLGGVFDMLGIPWVGGSASTAEEPSWGPGNPTAKGDYWTDELVKAINAGGAGDKVGSDIGTANANDPARPGGAINTMFPQAKENPQLASGGMGDSIMWNSAASHEVVLFAGKPDGQRHVNDLNNMNTALANRLTGENIQTSPAGGGTTQDLKDMIMTAITNIAASNDHQQLVLYFTDHGDTDFDVDEFINGLPDLLLPITPTNPLDELLPLHDGWKFGFEQAFPLQPLEPYLEWQLSPSSSLMDLSQWGLWFQDQQIPLPSLVLNPGDVFKIPLPAALFDFGLNHLQLAPLSGASVDLLNMELSNGGITTLVTVPEPATCTLMLLGLVSCLYRRLIRRSGN
jgi:hypothetical protein